MLDSFSEARQLAQKVKYSEDKLNHGEGLIQIDLRHVFSSSMQNELKLSAAVTPSIFEHFSNVRKRLMLKEEEIDVFIYASPEIQAECIAENFNSCLLRLSSALIELLSGDELEFVMGHEIGHFLLGHGLARIRYKSESLEFYSQTRNQEISVDRIGLIACGSLNTAIRAMIKTVSGLSEKHLRFDVNAFVKQLEEKPTSVSTLSTHPSMFVRCRSLLWFSLSKSFNNGNLQFDEGELDKLDRQILKDFESYVDVSVIEALNEAKEDVLLWLTIQKIVEDGAFKKNEQEKVQARFGSDILIKIKTYLEEMPVNDAENETFKRLHASRNTLEEMIPDTFEQVYRILENERQEIL